MAAGHLPTGSHILHGVGLIIMIGWPHLLCKISMIPHCHLSIQKPPVHRVDVVHDDVITRSRESRDHLLWPIMAMWKELNVWLGHQIKCIETMGREFNWTASWPWLFHSFNPERVCLSRSPRLFRRLKSYLGSRGWFAVQRVIRCDFYLQIITKNIAWNHDGTAMHRWPLI